MTNEIRHKRSATEDNAPLAGQLEHGELAVNYHENSANIHFKDSANAVRSVGADPATAGTYVRSSLVTVMR